MVIGKKNKAKTPPNSPKAVNTELKHKIKLQINMIIATILKK